MQKTQQRAMEHQGMPTMPDIPGMPDLSTIPGMPSGMGGAQASSESKIADCCHVQSVSWLGSMEVSMCLAEDGQYPDTESYQGEVGITLYNPIVTDGRKIDNSKELNTGAQTFVNLDNDDKNDRFDFEDEAMRKNDDELVRMVLSMPIREHGFIQFLKTTADDGAIKVWEDARKETEFTEFTENDDKLEIPAFLEEEDGEWRKELWVEGLKPSQSQKDTRFEFVYTQKEKHKKEDGESDEVAITVIGIEKVEWKGQESGSEESDELDEELNWAELSISGEPGGKMLRVFPGKKALGGAPGDRAKDRVTTPWERPFTSNQVRNWKTSTLALRGGG